MFPFSLLQLVEKLFRTKWTKFDGLGGLILTPTRELAMQIWEELRKVRALLYVFVCVYV